MFDIDEAIEALIEAAGDDCPPVWAAFDRDDGVPDGFVLHQDPDRILGWRAPAECWAVGVLSGATAWVVGDPGDPGDGGERCRVACVVDRWGTVSARVHFADGRMVGDAPEAGRVIDMLSRCLGVRTAPADSGPAHTLALLWLAALAGKQDRFVQQIGWGDAIALHPVVQLLEWDPSVTSDRSEYGGDGRRLAPPERIGDPSASVVAAAARRWSWADVRDRCIGAQVPLGDVSPDLAAWMDDGMLSRWLDQDSQPVALLVDTAFDVLRPEDHTALRRVLLAACDADGPGPDDIRRHRHPRRSSSSSGAFRPGS